MTVLLTVFGLVLKHLILQRPRSLRLLMTYCWLSTEVTAPLCPFSFKGYIWYNWSWYPLALLGNSCRRQALGSQTIVFIPLQLNFFCIASGESLFLDDPVVLRCPSGLCHRPLSDLYMYMLPLDHII